MKGPTLQNSAALSAALHLTVLLLSMLILRHSNNIVMPSPYIVSLVSPGNLQKTDTSETATPDADPKGTSLSDEKEITKNSREDKTALKRLEDRISELDAKKRVERIVKLRSIISLKGKEEQNTQKLSAQGVNTGASKGTLFDSYYAKIRSEIWQEWIYPDTGDKNLETIIFVKISKDGTVNVQGLEKSSGNILFDRSALKAIGKASPVTAPPYEMEIGIRFYP